MMVCVQFPKLAPDTCPVPPDIGHSSSAPDTGHMPLLLDTCPAPRTPCNSWHQKLVQCLHTAGVSITRLGIATPAEPDGAQHPTGTAPTSKSSTLGGTSTTGTVTLQPGSPKVLHSLPPDTLLVHIILPRVARSHTSCKDRDAMGLPCDTYNPLMGVLRTPMGLP